MESVRNMIFCTIRVWVSEVRSLCTLRPPLPSSPHQYVLIVGVFLFQFINARPDRTGGLIQKRTRHEGNKQEHNMIVYNNNNNNSLYVRKEQRS